MVEGDAIFRVVVGL